MPAPTPAAAPAPDPDPSTPQVMHPPDVEEPVGGDAPQPVILFRARAVNQGSARELRVVSL